jgi:uncharacterized protein
MKCPIDGTDLVMSERNGIEIDYCPQCRGVWLDRGELDKIIERAAAYEQRISQPQQPPQPQAPTQPQYQQPPQQPTVIYYDDDDDDYYKRHGYHRKKKGFLGDMFDIFD